MLCSLSLFTPRVLLATSFPALVQGITGDTCKPKQALLGDVIIGDEAESCRHWTVEIVNIEWSCKLHIALETACYAVAYTTTLGR